MIRNIAYDNRITTEKIKNVFLILEIQMVLKPVISNNLILHPSVRTMVPSVADIF